MKSLFIMGLPRSGTTVTRDLFEDIPGLTVLKEVSMDQVGQAINDGRTVVWKSPADCLNGDLLSKRFPGAAQVHVIRDGRQNLAAHKKYLETYGVDYLWGPYKGIKGFAELWNDFAFQVLRAQAVFRLEDLIRSSGAGIIRSIYKLCDYPGAEQAIAFWLDNIYEGHRRMPYLRSAVSLETRAWEQALTQEEASWIDRDLLRGLGYV